MIWAHTQTFPEAILDLDNISQHIRPDTHRKLDYLNNRRTTHCKINKQIQAMQEWAFSLAVQEAHILHIQEARFNTRLRFLPMQTLEAMDRQSK